MTAVSLDDVQDINPRVQYIASAGQTIFPYPFPITQDSDLLLYINGIAQGVDSVYTLTGVGNDTGGNLVLNAGANNGDVYTLVRDIPIERLTQFSQNGGFSSQAFNDEFNNVYLILQQLEANLGLTLQISTTTTGNPTVILDPVLYANTLLGFDANGNPVPAINTTSGAITAAVIQQLYYPRTQAEINAGIIPNPYPYGDCRRYGIFPDNVALAGANAMAFFNLANPATNGPTGKIYFPNLTGMSQYYFNDLVQLRPGLNLDLCGSTLNFSKQTVFADDNNGFLWCERNNVIENGTLYYRTLAGSASNAAVAGIFFGGRGSPVSGSKLPTINDNQLTEQMGKIVLRNLRLDGASVVTGTLWGCGALGGVNNVLIENVFIEGNNSLVNGFYVEFGYATPGSIHTSTAQTSHAHNWFLRNVTVQNLSSAGASNSGWGSNGAYNLVFDNFEVRNAPGVIAIGSGESMFLSPWAGVDDFGTLAQQGALYGSSSNGRNVYLRNITGRNISGTAVVVGGACPNSLPNSNIPPWLPNTVYAIGFVVYNGNNKYTCASNGTSSNTAGFAGPKGQGAAIVDGTTSWNYTSTGVNNGYRGWAPNYSYQVNDVAIGGQYLYICTTGGVSGLHQGPTGVGTGIAESGDGGSPVVWSSQPTSVAGAAPVSSAWQLSVNQLSLTLENFTFDSGTTGTLSGGYGVSFTGDIGHIRHGRITNMSRGIATGGDVEQVVIEGVKVLNSGDTVGMEIGAPTGSIFYPSRQVQGAIRNCVIAGTSNAGAAPAYGIVLSNCASFEIANNRLGYELIHDGIAETTQDYGVYLPVISNANIAYAGVICRSNYLSLFAGGVGYFMYPSTNSFGCAIDDALGPTQTYSGAWEGVPQQTTPTLTCGTPGNLSITSYTVNKLDYIKRNQEVTFTLEISVPAPFTWTTASGNVIITGLPYAMNNSAVGSLPVFSMNFQGITKASYTQFAGTTSSGSTQISISCSGSGQADATLQIADMPSAGTVKIFMSGRYFTN